MKDDFKLNSSLTTKLASGQCLDDQRSLLIQFKNSIIFNETLSVKLVTWNQSEDCRHVISLELDQESISGGIENSTSLLGFQYLEKLNLAYYRLHDIQIPKGIYNLANLTYLNLSNAGFVGQIPIEVSRMTRLVTLDLSIFFFDLYSSPTWPMKLENPNLKTLVQNLKELRELHLDGVSISAPGSEWCQALSSSLPNLSSLSLSNCFLSGPLDSSLSQLQNLSFLSLDENNLSTTIPYSFANFPKLTTLSMFSCSLQGFFPEKIFQLPTLQNLYLGNNNLLNGNLPQFHWGGSLREIILSYTNFSGSLPDSIGNLGMLSWIDLMDCKFTGLLPLFNMAKKLTHIDLSSNGLTGSLSSMHFEGLNDLEHIDLSYNSLNGSIPPALFELPSLQELQLINNQFGGQVNEASSTSSSQLYTLDLSSNLLEGPIPNFFFELRNLTFSFFHPTSLTALYTWKISVTSKTSRFLSSITIACQSTQASALRAHIHFHN
ncbi:verticillium wilt disease resistance [Olea europaea subsp. europaea]|uniref:Verticillium wilt disease resistance n=1 Tax=Olea europaea subsp. europaea TaxID=158383 RepID=A0A8S0TB97_OLEEU|nr:verticillium wilt disease resistance [Olea europaea subsp. europaea]